MIGYLLDTNVVSELTKPSRDFRVITFLNDQNDLWFSVFVVHELEYGVQGTPEGQRRDRMRAYYRKFIDSHASRILPIDRTIAERAAQLRAQKGLAGRQLNLADALIAGTALTHDLRIATRIVRHFDDLGVDITDPWNTS